MKLNKSILFVLITIALILGVMIGLSFDPIDSAIRKAQKINKGNLSGVRSFRSGSSRNLFSIFKKSEPLNEESKNDLGFKTPYLANKEKAIQILDETKEFIKLATQEVFIDNSLHKYLLSLGRIQIQNGMIFEAVKNVERAYEINPVHPSTSNLLAQCYLALYQILPEGSEKSDIGQKAIHFLNLTLKSNMNDMNALYGLALIYNDQEEYQKALSLLLQILDKDPENIEAMLAIARIYYNNKNINKARQIYEQTEALILEIKGRNSLFKRAAFNEGRLDQKLSIIRKNLEMIYKNK